MKRKIRIVITFMALVFTSLPLSAKDTASGHLDSENYWSDVMNAIIHVESGGDEKARSGQSVGAMQITPILVAECNQILKKRRSKKRFKLSDRLNLSKSKEMFLLFQSWHNPTNNIEKAIRSWNGGLNYSVKRTQRYFEKVMRAMNKR